MSNPDPYPPSLCCTGETLTLIRPAVRYRRPWLEMAADYLRAGEPELAHAVDLARSDFARFVWLLDDTAAGRNLRPGFVPETVLWLLRDDRDLVGETSIRHQLNAHLRHEGGHIGYQVRPSARRRGYGTAALALTLEYVQAMHMDRVLVTCDTDNLGSARIIEKHGGVLENCVTSRKTGKAKARYWIEM